MRLLIALAAGVFGYCYYRGREMHFQKPKTREDIQRWEDEGGNVPSVATPRPQGVAQGVDPGAMH
jgi:hypothetical protein